MKAKKNPDGPALPCTSLRADDGVLPVELARRERYQKTPNQAREGQLCQQVMYALDASMSCDCPAPELADVEVVEVTPGRGLHQLVVHVAIPDTSPEAIEATHRALTECTGILRAAVAADIHRKRVPGLRFVVVARDE
jgi:ribosome-binding factor A